MKRGWCPGLDTPMASGDGLLVRVQAPEARLTPDAARILAGAAERHGNGMLELTSRGNIQVRGLSETSVPRFTETMLAAGLHGPTPLLPPPLLGDDPGLHSGTGRLVAVLAEALAAFELPPKFAVAVDGGGVLGGLPLPGDLVVHPEPLMDGGMLTAPPTSVPDSVDGRVKPGHDVRGRIGPVGRLAYATGGAAFGLAAPFGQMSAGMLRKAANWAERFGTALRLTPWRVLLLGCVPDWAAPTPAGWITDPGDPRLLVSACVGAPGCCSGEVPTRGRAAVLRPSVPVHVSGCAKGCAHPGPTTVTLVGRAGRYDVVLCGRAGDSPTVSGLSWSEAAALIP